MAWLDDNPPVRSQFRDPRRSRPTGLIVVHTAESVMDTVGPDTGAENVARFIRTRDTPGSYHDLVDSDSSIHLVRYDCEAFQDGTGSNPYALSLSFACSYLDWANMTTDRRARFLVRGVMAAVLQAKWIYDQTGIRVPATRISRDDSAAGLPGFISHAKRDPDRRKDPGDARGQFPWDTFLGMFQSSMYPTPTPPPTPPPTTYEEPTVPTLYKRIGTTDPAQALWYDGGKLMRATGRTIRPSTNYTEVEVDNTGWDTVIEALGPVIS